MMRVLNRQRKTVWQVQEEVRDWDEVDVLMERNVELIPQKR